MSDELPEVHFGLSESKPIDWRKTEDKPEPDDDEELAQTPTDVVAMLGFDPKRKDERFGPKRR